MPDKGLQPPATAAAREAAAASWPKAHLCWAAVLTLAFVAAFIVPLRSIVHTWATNDDYSYGYLVPVISAYLFWDMRSRAVGLRPRPSWSALVPLVLLVLLSIYGILGSSGNISRPAVPVVFMLMFAFAFGWRTFRRFALPLGFLIFMVPLPAALDRSFGVFLKAVSSQLGGWLVRMSGIPVHVSGNVIDLGVTQLQVVDACSGLRFVFPLLALGVVYAYFFEKVRWKQVVCVLATVPVAILTNGLRIGITGVLTRYIGPEVAQGFFHDFSGWVIFMVAFLFLFALGRFLRLFPPRAPLATPGPPSGAADGSGSRGPGSRGIGAYLVCLLLLASVGTLGMTTATMPPVHLKNGIAAFPLTMQPWTGIPQPVDATIIEASGAEEAFFADYRDARNDSVSLYIGYRSTSFLENENFFHSPTVCLPSSGWKNAATSTHSIENVPRFGTLKVTRMVIERMGMRQLVYFWFQTKDRATHDKNINRFHLTLHAIQRDNTHDLFLRTITPVRNDESLEAAGARMDDFVRTSVSTMERFLAKNLQVSREG